MMSPLPKQWAVCRNAKPVLVTSDGSAVLACLGALGSDATPACPMPMTPLKHSEAVEKHSQRQCEASCGAAHVMHSDLVCCSTESCNAMLYLVIPDAQAPANMQVLSGKNFAYVPTSRQWAQVLPVQTMTDVELQVGCGQHCEIVLQGG